MEVGSYTAERKTKKRKNKNRPKRATNGGPANPLVAVCGGTFRCSLSLRLASVIFALPTGTSMG